MSGDCSDKELLTASDDASSFRILYERYWEILYRKAVSRLGNDADAQDVVQEVFISLWRNRLSIAVEGSVSPYLLTALKYCIIKKVHRQARKGIILPLSVEDLAQSELSGEELIQYKELQKIVEGEVARLPQRMQQVYRLSRGAELSVMEIAVQLNISEQTVKNTLTTVNKRLRDSLARVGGLLPFLF